MSVVLPQPKKSARRALGGAWLGIDIGTSGVKIAEVLHHRKGLRWLSRAYRKFSEPLSDKILGGAEVEKLIGDEIPRSADGVRRPAVVSLPSRWCVTRPVDMQSVSEIRKQMEAELGPDPQWCAWPLREHAGQRYAMAVGVGSEVAGAIGRVVQNAGHQCVKIDAHSLALHRSVSLQQGSQSFCAILDWGWDSATLVTCDESGPGLVRQLPNSGLREFVRVSAERFDCSDAAVLRQLREAESMPVSDSDSRRTSDGVRESLCPHLERICHEVSQSLAYARRIGCKLHDGPLLLSGGAGSLGPVASLMQDKLGFEVVNWTWSHQTRFQRTQWTPSDSMFATALSLACGGGV